MRVPQPGLSPDMLRACFRRRRTADLAAYHCDTHRAAAVLMLIIPGSQGLEVVLTRRAHHLPNHAGQISFPGGSRESGDASLLDTALREAHEEIGLDARQVDVLGSLEAAHLPSGFCVTPVVALAGELPPLRPDPGEVEMVFTVPLSLVLDIGIYRRGSRMRNGIKRNFYYFDFQGHYIWGATAGMLRALALEMQAVLTGKGS